MNRRGFFRALAATAIVTLATHTRLGQLAPITARTYEEDEESAQAYESAARAYVEALACSMQQTKETLAANILNNAFTPSTPSTPWYLPRPEPRGIRRFWRSARSHLHRR